MACGILIPWPGTESGPLLWKQEVLTTRPPGKSHDLFFFFFSCDFSTALIYQILCFPKCYFKDGYTFPGHTSESVLRVGCFLVTQPCRRTQHKHTCWANPADKPLTLPEQSVLDTQRKTSKDMKQGNGLALECFQKKATQNQHEPMIICASKNS